MAGLVRSSDSLVNKNKENHIGARVAKLKARVSVKTEANNRQAVSRRPRPKNAHLP